MVNHGGTFGRVVLTALTLAACTPASTPGTSASPPRSSPHAAESVAPSQPPATMSSQDAPPGRVSVERLEVCAPGEASDLELFPHARLLIARCNKQCKAIPIDAAGVLGTPGPCDLGSPALKRADANIATLFGDWPRRVVLGSWVGAAAQPGDPPDLVALALQVGSGGRWTSAARPERGPFGVGEWTGGTLVTPSFDGSQVRFVGLGTVARGVRLPEAPAVSGITQVHHFASLESGDAVLVAAGDDRLVVWRWRAGEPRPVVEELPRRNMWDPATPDFHPVALRSGTDLWIGVNSNEVPGPEVLRCDGAAWTSSYAWRPIDERAAGPSERIEEISLGLDGAVWVHFSGASRAGIWRRRPGNTDRWDHLATDLIGWERPFALERLVAAGSDLLVVGTPSDEGVGGDRLMRIRVTQPPGAAP